MNHRKNVNHPFMFGEPMIPQLVGYTSYLQLLVRASGNFDRMPTLAQGRPSSADLSQTHAVLTY
jgi:hypothetical protein